MSSRHRLYRRGLTSKGDDDDVGFESGSANAAEDDLLLDRKEINRKSLSIPSTGEPVHAKFKDGTTSPVAYASGEDSESTVIEYTSDGRCIPAGPIGKLKEATANFLVEPSVEIFIALVVLLNSMLVALSTLDSLDNFLPYILNAELVIGVIFFVDFVARWFSSNREQWGFVLDPQFVADIFVVILPLAVSITPASFWEDITFLPSGLTQPSGLFTIKLLRVLQLRRFLQDLDTFEGFVEKALGKNNGKTYIVQDWQLQLARVVLSLATLISVASGLIYTAEHTTNPNINNYFDALYFGLTTLTTVGFGDVSPVTWQGRLIVCGSILFGVAVVPAQAGALVEALLDRENINKNGRKKGIGTKLTNDRETSIDGATEGSNTNRNASEEADLALDVTYTCQNCGASFHWSSAQYCYRCGEKIYKL